MKLTVGELCKLIAEEVDPFQDESVLLKQASADVRDTYVALFELERALERIASTTKGDRSLVTKGLGLVEHALNDMHAIDGILEIVGSKRRH